MRAGPRTMLAKSDHFGYFSLMVLSGASDGNRFRTSARGPRGPYASTPARRAEIVRAALASFAVHGYERASLRDIAARADVSHSALLRHFASKDELLLAALAQRDIDDEELARHILETQAPAEHVLSQVLADEFAHPDAQRHWLALIVAATQPDHPAHSFFVGRRERMRTRLFAGRFGTADNGALLSADEKVTMLMAMIDGMRIQALLDPTRETLPLLDVFVRSLVETVDD